MYFHTEKVFFVKEMSKYGTKKALLLKRRRHRQVNGTPALWRIRRYLLHAPNYEKTIIEELLLSKGQQEVSCEEYRRFDLDHAQCVSQDNVHMMVYRDMKNVHSKGDIFMCSVIPHTTETWINCQVSGTLQTHAKKVFIEESSTVHSVCGLHDEPVPTVRWTDTEWKRLTDAYTAMQKHTKGRLWYESCSDVTLARILEFKDAHPEYEDRWQQFCTHAV